MPLRRILRYFQIRLPDGKLVSFAPGVIDVPTSLAGHWFMLDNSIAVTDPNAVPKPLPSATLVHIDGKPPMTADEFTKFRQENMPRAVAPNPVAPQGMSGDAPIAETDAEKAEDVRLAAAGITRDDLIRRAVDLGVRVDGRWGDARIEAEIEAVTAGR